MYKRQIFTISVYFLSSEALLSITILFLYGILNVINVPLNSVDNFLNLFSPTLQFLSSNKYPPFSSNITSHPEHIVISPFSSLIYFLNKYSPRPPA